MMGGGGGWSLSKDELKKLEEVAKENLKQGAQPAKRNIFISFIKEDLDEVNLLRGQAKNEDNDLEFNDWSLRESFNSKQAEYIQRGIRERIRLSSATMVYLSDITYRSKWVNWEIQESIKLGKQVIGVYKGDSPPKILPSSIIKYRCKLIKWTHKGIATAIENSTSSGK
jgi:MTH538 TIR-like domain (DUF1863)